MAIQAAFMARRFVVMDQTLVGAAVDYRYGFSVSRLGSGFIAVGDSADDFFEVSAQFGSIRSVVLAADFGLPGSFARLG